MWWRRGQQSIRRSFLLVGGVLSAIGLVLALTTSVTAYWLYSLSQRSADAITSLKAVEEVEINLLRSTRAHQLYGETGEERWRAEWQRDEARLVEDLRTIQRSATGAHEREMVAALTEQVEMIREHVLHAPPGERAVRLSDLDAAAALSGEMAEQYERRAQEAAARTTAWSRIVLLITIGSILAMVASLGLAFRYTSRAIYEPVQRLRRSLEEHPLDSPARIPVEAPLEVREIAMGINELIDRIAAQREQQLTFLAAVAHDLKNPLASLRTAVQLAARQAQDEKQKARAEVILRQVDRMNRQVEDLLDVSRIEAGRFELALQLADLREVIGDTVAMFRDASERHEIRLELPDVPVLVEHDPTRIAQVLTNLVSNAIKYSPEGGPIDVRLRQEGGAAVFEVEDRGLGIPREEWRSIFEPFRRSGGGRGSIPGVGLGLSVARRLVRAHGGEIEVESEPGQGSTFRVVLPLARRRDTRDEAPAEASAGA